jgi:hypothetical protein
MAVEESKARAVRGTPARLRMEKRRTRKEDGRYLIYYCFGETAEEAPQGAKEAR